MMPVGDVRRIRHLYNMLFGVPWKIWFCPELASASLYKWRSSLIISSFHLNLSLY